MLLSEAEVLQSNESLSAFTFEIQRVVGSVLL